MEKMTDSKIQYLVWNSLEPKTRHTIMRRSQETIESVIPKVLPIIDNVRQNGDKALFEYAATFDKAAINKNNLKVTDAEFDAAAKSLPQSLKNAIDRCIKNVRLFHEEQMRHVKKDWMIEIEPGIFAGEKVTPISSVGLYVPGGKNAFPSALYMLAIPAIIAGVPEIIVTTPPRADGSINPASLYAAQQSGVRHIYKTGGAQAIAAMALGTETIPKTCKTLGPGSPYVAAAKQILSNTIDAGMPAGPSESIVLCDESADPRTTLLDIINEAEHGPDSATLLITHDRTLADILHKNLPALIDTMPEPQRSWLYTVFSTYGGIILTENLDQSIALANEYAAEHLLLKVKNPDDIIPRLHNAGEILIGEWSSFTLGNYGTGVNHVLPTGGWAHSYSCTTVWDFLKRTSLSHVTEEGFKSLAPDVACLAEFEGFPAHVRALKDRL